MISTCAHEACDSSLSVRGELRLPSAHRLHESLGRIPPLILRHVASYDSPVGCGDFPAKSPLRFAHLLSISSGSVLCSRGLDTVHMRGNIPRSNSSPAAWRSGPSA